MFTIIIDSSLAYLYYLRDKELKVNLVDSYERVDSYKDIMSFNLFGDSSPALIELKNSESVKSFYEELFQASSQDIEEKRDVGVLVLVNTARTITKKLEKLAKEKDIKLIIPKVDSKNITEKIVRDSALSCSVKNYLIDYAGEDYELVLSFLNAIDSIPVSVHGKLTVDDVVIRLPYPPGSKPPWDLINYYRAGNYQSLLDEYDDIVSQSSPIALIALFKNNVYKMCEIKVLSQGVSSFRDYIKEYSLKETYPLKLAFQSSQKRSLQSLLHDYNSLVEMENNIKNGSVLYPVKELKTVLLVLTKNMGRGL